MTDREKDEQLLNMPDMRRRGKTVNQIAKRLSLLPHYVRRSTDKVKASDAAESGEPTAGAYW